MVRAALSLFLTCLATYAQPVKRPFDAEATMRVARVSDPALSPDGAQAAFVVQRVFASENRSEKHIWTVPVDGGAARQLTFEGEANTRPRWAPDGSAIYFVSDRSGSSQIWRMASDGTDARQITKLAAEAEGVLVSPTGDRIVFASRVYPECGADDACNAHLLERDAEAPVKARLYESLLYRHWNRFDDGRRSHLLSLSLTEPGAEPVDLTPGPRDAPPFSLGGPDGYAISPDGLEVCFEAKTAERPALSTDVNLYVVPIAGGAARPIASNPAADASPAYSPDGAWLAYRRQDRAGYESDRWRLVLMNRETGEAVSLSDALDRPVTSLAWSPDSARLFFTAEDRGREPIFTVPVGGGAQRMVVFGNASHGDIQLAPDGRSMIYSAQSGSRPVEIFRVLSSGGSPTQLTRFNEELFERHETTALEEVEFAGGDGARVGGFVVKPPGFDVQKRYPLLVLVHGGPQGAWGESWSYRWNYQVFAAAGYVVFLPNPRGSTGYGQRFTDEIRADWGGKVYDDILAGVDHVLARPYVDATRVYVAGASYGGYMVNWMLGRTQRFRAAVSHAGVYDLPSFFGATEEMWFPLWEFLGPPWEQADLYRKLSPSQAADKFKTPTLVVHGQLDYRVPVEQGMQLFTALQMREVPSQFLYFPDEGHWVTKPRNSLEWYRTVLGWLARWDR